MQPHSFIIAAANGVYGQGLAGLLITTYKEALVTVTADYAALLGAAGQNNCNLAFIDADLPPHGGYRATEQLRRQHRNCKTILYTHAADTALMIKAFAAGASAFFFSSEPPDGILHTAAEVLAKGYCVTATTFSAYASAHQRLLNATGEKALTLREKEVLQLILAGCTSKQAAAQLYVAEKTIVNHRNNIHIKTGCHNVAQLLKYVQENGLV